MGCGKGVREKKELGIRSPLAMKAINGQNDIHNNDNKTKTKQKKGKEGEGTRRRRKGGLSLHCEQHASARTCRRKRQSSRRCL